MLNDALCEPVSPTRLWAVLSSILLFVLSRPLIVVMVIGAIATLPWVLRRRRWQKPTVRLTVTLAVLYLIVISPMFAQFGNQLLVKFLPADSGAKADAIVVLGRGQEQNPRRANIAGTLWQAKRAPLIFPSGRSDAPAIAQLIRATFGDAPVGGEPCSLTTDQNAEFTAALLRPQGVKSIILVTDPPHMWRSLLTFKSFGFEVIPYFSPLANNTHPVKKRFLVIRESIGLLSYGLMGRYAAREVPPPSIIYDDQQSANPSAGSSANSSAASLATTF
jgi:uncharacterized SAM-binding protein YcdF (DUF218 family)